MFYYWFINRFKPTYDQVEHSSETQDAMNFITRNLKFNFYPKDS